MLRTPRLQPKDALFSIIASFNKGASKHGEYEIEPGYVHIPGFNAGYSIYPGGHPPYFEYQYPEFNDVGLNCYGVCDSPQQFIAKYDKLLRDDPRTFCVAFSHVAKDPTNKEGGGWRWHKWGPYIGGGEPQCEYLDDEDGFDDGVYVYHIIRLMDLS